jgi:antitoxin component YwqK of YwqJK toxin-antitoxin module
MKTEIKRGYYDNGNLSYEYPYINGVRYGIQVRYYDNGQKYLEYQCVNNKNYGIEQHWNLFSTRETTLQRKKDILHGLIIRFYYYGS